MANHTPISGASDGAGGYLIPEEFGQTLMDGLRRESAVAGLARVDRVGARVKNYSIYSGRPAVDFVEESGEKPATGAEFGEVTVNIKKLAAIVIYTEEILEDAKEDPRRLVNADVIAAFADKIDAHALGYAAGSPISGSFDSELCNTTASAEIGTTGDAFAAALSNSIEDVESCGYRPNGIVAASDVRAHLRDARNTVETTQPVYTAGFSREPDSLYGLPVSYSSNLDGFGTGADQVAAVVGDWSHAILAVRKDITIRTSDSATVTVGGTPRNLWQRNETAVLWEMRVGFAVHDLNRAFSKVTNAV